MPTDEARARERELFENWIADGNPNTIVRWPTDGTYVSLHTAHDWRVWLAATAAARREEQSNPALENAARALVKATVGMLKQWNLTGTDDGANCADISTAKQACDTAIKGVYAAIRQGTAPERGGEKG